MSTQYLCHTHEFESPSKMALQLHTSGNIGCFLGIRREDLLQEEAPKPYTMTQVFGWFDGDKCNDRLINCQVCGCAVSYDDFMMEKHRKWHNGEEE